MTNRIPITIKRPGPVARRATGRERGLEWVAVVLACLWMLAAGFAISQAQARRDAAGAPLATACDAAAALADTEWEGR